LVNLFESYDDARTCESQIYYFCFRVDRNEVSFKVEPNNLGLNASDVANIIGKCPVIYLHANLMVNLRYTLSWQRIFTNGAAAVVLLEPGTHCPHVT
jgi:hypothetical protein